MTKRNWDFFKSIPNFALEIINFFIKNRLYWQTNFEKLEKNGTLPTSKILNVLLEKGSTGNRFI